MATWNLEMENHGFFNFVAFLLTEGDAMLHAFILFVGGLANEGQGSKRNVF